MPGFEEMWFHKVELLREEADDQTAKALRKAGWAHTSQTPCSIWMWQKEIGGVTYSLSRDDAASIQEHTDREAYFRAWPDELGD